MSLETIFGLLEKNHNELDGKLHEIISQYGIMETLFVFYAIMLSQLDPNHPKYFIGRSESESEH